MRQRPGASRDVVTKRPVDRGSDDPFLRSIEDCGPELIVHVPFSEVVKIHSVCLRGPSAAFGEAGCGPNKAKLFVDREDVDFSTAEDLPAHMEIDLMCDSQADTGNVHYPTRGKIGFQSATSVTLFFGENFSGDEDVQTLVSFIGFKGKSTKMKRKCVEAVYESRAMLKDHKTPSGESTSRSLI